MLAWLMNLDFAGGGTPSAPSMAAGERVLRRRRESAYSYGYRYLMGVCLWMR